MALPFSGVPFRVASSGLSPERKVLCALRLFATGSFQSSVGHEELIGVAQLAVSNTIHEVTEAIISVTAQRKLVDFPLTPDAKDEAKAAFAEHGYIPGVLACADGTLVSIRTPQGRGIGDTAGFMSRKGYYALNVMVALARFATYPICDVSRTVYLLPTDQQSNQPVHSDSSEAPYHLMTFNDYPQDASLRLTRTAASTKQPVSAQAITRLGASHRFSGHGKITCGTMAQFRFVRLFYFMRQQTYLAFPVPPRTVYRI
ncbi:hypothetical protein HPB50_010384 [Hyalomma asiaticum]|uniref:Uncharacterized protein n=1 Tax=Hyalomma asiaticum TaxID=266040 RepID=A0ACB7TFC6_HYAAI|nr:hypothetical protein HPB50_010384 [Hyalomma asiaticum]